MIYINAFIFCGIVCLIAQFILENTKLTPGHVNTLLVVIGSILAGFGLYEIFVEWAGAGASVPIMNFGYLLVEAAYNGYMDEGFTGLIQNILAGVSGGISITIIISFLVAILFKPKN
jgi:stage V sporulation protein AE